MIAHKKPQWVHWVQAFTQCNMMTSSNGNIFRITSPLCGKFTGHRLIPLTKASDAELWCFLWSAPKINGCANNQEAGDLRCHHAHYDVTIMKITEIRLKNDFYVSPGILLLIRIISIIKYGMKLLIHSQTSMVVKVWKWISNFIPNFTGHVITYPCWDWS